MRTWRDDEQVVHAVVLAFENPELALIGHSLEGDDFADFQHPLAAYNGLFLVLQERLVQVLEVLADGVEFGVDDFAF